MSGVEPPLFQTNDGGEIDPYSLTPGLENMAYICLFGGNVDDDGSEGASTNWWGNLDEADPVRRVRSETQYLLGALPPSSANLRRIEDAATRDLSAFTSAGIAREISVSASLTGINRVGIVANIDGQTFEFSETWEASIE